MLFQVLYVLCVMLWFIAPDLAGHVLLTQLFPQFRLLDLSNFIYGLIASGVYGWFVSAIFVFFYNLWPRFASAIFGSKAVTQ